MGSVVIDERLQAELAQAANRCGCELLDVQFGAGVLRLILDREGGVTLEDCETVSRDVSALLDVEDFGAGRYTLEVSSPGLDRPLYGPRDYERFAGSRVRVTFDDEGSGKRTVVGRLERFDRLEDDADAVTLSETDVGTEELVIPYPRIRAARLEPDL